MIIEPWIVDQLEDFGASPWNGEVWRHVFEGRDPLAPSMRAGRWAPEGEFSVLYTSLDRDAAIAEAEHLISLHSIAPDRDRFIVRISVDLPRVVDLTVAGRLPALGVDPATYAELWGNCPDIGAAANLLQYQGIIAPSARGNSANLMILTDQQDAKCEVEVVNKKKL